MTWTTIADAPGFAPGAVLSDVAVLPSGKAAIVGVTNFADDARVWASDDGLKWKSKRLPNGKRAQAVKVAAVDDGFVAIGTDYRRTVRVKRSGGDAYGTMPDGLVWLSKDGEKWSKPVTLKNAELVSITVAPDSLIVGGTVVSKNLKKRTPTVWTSSDGRKWKGTKVGPAATGFGRTVADLAASDDGIVLALDEHRANNPLAQLLRSVGGSKFSKVALPAGDPVDLIGTSTGFALLTAQDGAMTMWESLDGMDWESAKTLPGEWDRSGRLVSEQDLATLLVEDLGGSWCMAEAPLTDGEYPASAVSSEDGTLTIVGIRANVKEPLKSEPLVWLATQASCVPI